MTIRVMLEDADNLLDYARIPIAFRVTTRYRLQPPESGAFGFVLVEEPVDPYVKDYDAIPGEGPMAWKSQWDLSHWAFLAAYDGQTRIGGAAVAWRTAGMCDLQGRDDVAALWDIRVHPDFRGMGVGSQLFDQSVVWSSARGCRTLRIETQNINMPACRFYVHQGCQLAAIDRFAYAPDLDEIQMIWYKAL